MFFLNSHTDIFSWKNPTPTYVFSLNSHTDIYSWKIPTLTSQFSCYPPWHLFLPNCLLSSHPGPVLWILKVTVGVFREVFISYYTLLCYVLFDYELQIKRNVFLCARFCYRFVNLQQSGDSSCELFRIWQNSKNTHSVQNMALTFSHSPRFIFCSKYVIFSSWFIFATQSSPLLFINAPPSEGNSNYI